MQTGMLWFIWHDAIVDWGVQHTFIESWLCVKHYVQHWREKDRKRPSPGVSTSWPSSLCVCVVRREQDGKSALKCTLKLRAPLSCEPSQIDLLALWPLVQLSEGLNWVTDGYPTAPSRLLITPFSCEMRKLTRTWYGQKDMKSKSLELNLGQRSFHSCSWKGYLTSLGLLLLV